MADPAPDLEPVITGLSALSACGRGAEVLYERAAAGDPAFGPVTRFDVSRFRAGAAAQLPGDPVLADELAAVTEEACAAARLSAGQRAGSRLLLKVVISPMIDAARGLLRWPVKSDPGLSVMRQRM
ncbi:hypothetical protein ACWEPB_09695, partial [Kitasatospora cineracea]